MVCDKRSGAPGSADKTPEVYRETSPTRQRLNTLTLRFQGIIKTFIEFAHKGIREAKLTGTAGRKAVIYSCAILKSRDCIQIQLKVSKCL